MTRVAIFVEGETESILTTRLLEVLCGKRGITIELHKQHGGVLQYVGSKGKEGTQFFAMIANCSSDGQVKTQIRDRYENLLRAGYTRVIGIRDVFPELRKNIPKIEEKSMFGMPSGVLPIDLHLAVMEVEAWFLDEITHFERIHTNLTTSRLISSGYDVQNIKGESWDHPADTLHKIYKLEGLAWRKTGDHIRRTVNALCMDSFYISAKQRSPSLSNFIASIESALFS